jgi:hypothetical protein
LSDCTLPQTCKLAQAEMKNVKSEQWVSEVCHTLRID